MHIARSYLICVVHEHLTHFEDRNSAVNRCIQSYLRSNRSAIESQSKRNRSAIESNPINNKPCLPTTYGRAPKYLRSAWEINTKSMSWMILFQSIHESNPIQIQIQIQIQSQSIQTFSMAVTESRQIEYPNHNPRESWSHQSRLNCIMAHLRWHLRYLCLLVC